MKSSIPNIITLGNLLAGCIGIVLVFDGQLEYGAYCIWIGAVFDFFDGLSARALRVKSEIGKELDSLADMVTFGVLPATICFKILSVSWEATLVPYIAFLIALMSAVRLAKFNIDSRQTQNFIGLPTPANAFFISSLVFISSSDSILSFLINPIGLIVLVISLSILLVAEIPLFSLKFENLGWAKNQIRYIFVFLSAIMLLYFMERAFPAIISFYILLSIGQNMSRKTL